MSEEKNNLTQDKNKNKGFVMGIVSTLAIVGIIGSVVFGILYLKGKNTIDNNQPINDAGDTVAEEKIDMVITDADHVLGNKDAKIKIFEFSDVQCPYCARFHTVMHQIVEEYPNDVAWIYRQFPIQSHPLGLPGAIALECAAGQGKFWEMSDLIFNNQDTLAESSFVQFATDISLDIDAFNACMSDNPYMDKISGDYQLGISSGVQGTPSSFVNGQIVPGALPYESMKKIIDELLK
ncbi:MAG: DsbA family protein [Patescibacteria group bacterium]